LVALELLELIVSSLLWANLASMLKGIILEKELRHFLLSLLVLHNGVVVALVPSSKILVLILC
jgi:hypothetical protein